MSKPPGAVGQGEFRVAVDLARRLIPGDGRGVQRRAVVGIVLLDGRLEFREDPAWFNDYMRREGVDWDVPGWTDSAVSGAQLEAN